MENNSRKKSLKKAVYMEKKYFEVVGIPGCGKTTVVSILKKKKEILVIEELKKLSINNKLSFLFSGRIVDLLFRISRVLETETTKYILKNSTLVNEYIKINNKRDISEDIMNKNLQWFLQTGAFLTLAQSYQKENKIFLQDEGLYHRLLSLLTDLSEVNKENLLIKLFHMIDNKPDFIIYVEADIDVTINRIRYRKKGLPKRYLNKTEQEIECIQLATKELYQKALDYLSNKGIKVLKIKNNLDLNSLREKVENVYKENIQSKLL